MSQSKLTDEIATNLWHGNLGLAAAASSTGCAPQTLKRHWIRLFGAEAYARRRAKIKGEAVKGLKHPTAKPEFQGKNHWNYKADARHVTPGAYVRIHAPDWWEGGRAGSSGYAYEHQVVYCEHHGLTKVPAGMVVHHINEDKADNGIENLQLMSRAEHINHHRATRGQVVAKGHRARAKSESGPTNVRC